MQFYLDIPFIFPGNVARTFDLIVPDDLPEKPPLLVWIHGGGWCGGEKRVYNAFERFTFRGFAVLSVDYRFSQDAMFPAQLIDCKTAVRWARANAEKYGYDAKRILVGGSSAGGHLSALMGLTNGRKEFDIGDYLEFSSDVQAVADLFGPADLTEGKFKTLMQDIQNLCGSDAEVRMLASPVHQVSPDAPPFLIVHGTADPLVPIAQSQALYAVLLDAGVSVTYLEVPGGGHGFDTNAFYACLTDFIEGQY